MVSYRSHRKNEQECECEDQFIWPCIKASTIPLEDPPPVVEPSRNIIPTVNRYFNIVTSDINLTNGATLSASQFWNDNGNQATECIIFNPSGYVNLYINAIMQETSNHVNLKSK